MKIIVRNTEPKYLASCEQCSLFHSWAGQEDAAVFDDNEAERIQGTIAGRFETWLEDA